MLFRLLLLFIVVPFVELALLLKLAEVTGWEFTLLLVIVTGVVGTALARSQGFRTYQQIQREFNAGRVPTDSLVDAVLIFFAGAVLLTPGILTDVLGLALLIPVTRKYFRRGMVRWFKTHFQVHTSFQNSSEQERRSEVIDSYVVDQHQDDEESH